MSGQPSIKLSILVPAVMFAILPLFSQVAPQPQGYPAQGGVAGVGDQEGPPGPAGGVARISLLSGDVSVRRGDSGDYVAAVQNAPVMVQDSIQTGNGARGEVQFDIANMVRIAQNTEVHFTDLQNGRFQMQLGRGTVTYRLLRDTNAQVEIDTPSISIRPTRQGIYRITVTDDGQSYVTPRAGQVEVFTPKGSQMVTVGQTLMARGDAADPEYQVAAALNRDEWDGWSESRDQALQQAWATTQRYIPQGVYGTEEMAGQGQWVNTPDYGYAWAPPVGPDWSPYSVGNWTYEPYYGWTWISYDPWGWAPFHYGRWFNRPGLGWMWWPGSMRSHYYFSPGLVGFFGFGSGIGGFGFGNIGWVALAPFERFHSWFGRGGGFGGSALLSNAGLVGTYRNAGVRNGVVAMNAQQFGRGSTGYSRVAGASLGSVSLMHGALPMKPTSQSLHFSNRQTSTTARTNFGQSRFASHATAPQVQRTPFAGTSGGRGFGTAASSNTLGRSGQVAGGSGWNRFGNSNAASPVPGARAFGSTAGTRNIPQSGTGSSGWSQYGPRGGSATAQPQGNTAYRGSPGGAYGGRSQLQISPPLVRQRGNSPTPNSGGPRYSAPSYAAPRYSAPSYSAPHYSAPAQQSAPSSGGHSSGGGGGHSSGGGNSHHR